MRTIKQRVAATETEGQKATPGGHRVRIVGEPEVTIVSARWSK